MSEPAGPSCCDGFSKREAAARLVGSTCAGHPLGGCVATLLILLAGCGGSPSESADASGFAQQPDGGAVINAGDASTGDVTATLDDATSVDAPTDAHDAAYDAGTGAVAVLGSVCASPAALACAGNAQKVTLLCNGGAWTVNQTCPSGQNCDSAPGPNQGTCASIDPLCADAGPGATSCSSPSQVLICGPDLLSHSSSMCASTTTCVAGACTGVCGPSQTQCSGTDIQTCDSSGQWGSPMTCYASEPAATAVIGQTCQAGVCACPSGDEECCTGGEDCACTPISSGTICE
jgi:hypothetical protein